MFVSPEKPNNDIGDVNLIPNRIHACTGIWLIFMVKFGKYIFDGSEGIFIHTHTTWLFGEHALLLYNGQFCAIQNHVHFLTGLVSGESPKQGFARKQPWYFSGQANGKPRSIGNHEWSEN